MSLKVEDLDASLRFYEALGFQVLGGDDDWKILGNGLTKIGLFAAHIEENILTFNPGLAQDAMADGPRPDGGMPQPLDEFTDVREIERQLVEAGIELRRSTENADGPEHIILVDPDGNRIMIDQFF